MVRCAPLRPRAATAKKKAAETVLEACRNSHQDDDIFRRESRAKPSFATVNGWGVDPKYDGYPTWLLYKG